MKPINNWDNIKAAGNYESLPAGGYICRIKAVKEVPNKRSAGTHLEIMFEVDEGEYKGFFERDYRNQNREDKFWGGIISQNIPDETSPKYEQQAGFFKRFIANVEESNPGYHWNWDEKTLVGRVIGVIFGEREKQSQRGTLYTATYADSIVSVEAIRSGNFKVPELKKLTPAASSFGGFGSFQPAPAPSDDLPF